MIAYRYYLSLGSNISPEINLPGAVQRLSGFGKISARSRVYESEPFDAPREQPNFLNAAVILYSAIKPDDFKTDVIRRVETDLGRSREIDRNAARTIDIDLLLIGLPGETVRLTGVQADEVFSRPFLAVPFADLAPDLQHPAKQQILNEQARIFLFEGRVKHRPDVRLE